MVAIQDETAACVIYGDQCDIVSLVQATNSSIHIDNKYFTVSIKLIQLASPSDDPSTQLPINATIVNDSFQILQAASSQSSFANSDVKLYVSSNRPTPDQFQFCIDNQVEFVDIDEEPERILEALSSSIWPGAKMKNETRSSGAIESSTDQNLQDRLHDVVEHGSMQDELDHLSALEDQDERDLGSLISLMNQVRGQGQNLSDGERRANAEQMISAIYQMLGDESESDTD